MSSKATIFYVLLLSIFVWSCTSDSQEELLIDSTNKVLDQQQPDSESTEELNIDILDFESRSGSGNCNNVIIVNGFAYASCNSQILIGELATGEITSMSASVINVTADAQRGLLFTYSGSQIRMFTLENPTAPEEVASTNASFSIFTGFSAAGCTLAVSGGTSNTTVFRYSANTFDLELTENSIPPVDNVTGTPNVHVTQTGPSEVTAFYSQDIGAVANWAIQPAIFNGVAELQSTPSRIVLTSGQFTGPFGAPFGPSNFPVESEYLDGRLYVAHFAVPGVEVIDVATGNLLPEIDLPYQPTNISTDGVSLFVVGVSNDEVDIIDPLTGDVIESLGSLNTPSSVAASETHIAVADQTLGLVIIPRS